MISRDAITAYRTPAVAGAGTIADRPDAGRSLVAVCWRRRWTVAVVLALTVAAALTYLSVAPKSYTSRSRLYVQQNAPRLLVNGSDPAQTQSDAYLFRQSEVIKAEPILKQVLLTVANSAPNLMSAPTPMTALQKGLTVAVGKKDEIITIEFDSLSPDEAAVVVNAIVAAYRQYSSNENQSSAANMLRVLRGEKEKQEKTLDVKLRQIVAFKQKNGEMFFTTDRGTNILVQSLASISEELTRAKLAAVAAHASFESTIGNKPLAFKMWQDAELQATEYEKAFEAEKAKALKINDAQAEFQKLQLEADRTTKLCDLLDSRIKELSVTEDAGVMNIQVLEEGKAEQRPTSPKRLTTLAAALAFGLALGGAAAVAHEALDQRVHAPDEAGRLMGLAVLGVIPVVRHAVASARKQLGRATHLAPNSDVAEAYRTLRAAVYYGWPDRSVKSVLVTSPERGDGKSTTASNLAIAMAQAGMRTLLIDADLRAAVQHKVFDVSNTAGLSDVISGGVAVEQAVRRTDIDGLELLPSGTPTNAPAEITNSQAFGRLLQKFEADYDIVVIDSPPLLAVADARILGAQAGMTILTLRADKSTRQDIKQACQQLLGVGSSILGVVLNGVTQRRRTTEYRGEDTPALIEQNRNGSGRGLPPGPDNGARVLTY